MNSAIERLLNLRVRDVMAREVVTISANCTMAEAAETIRDYSVTGVPVTDEKGRCIGILSSTDFVRSLRCGSEPRPPVSHQLSDSQPEGTLQIEEIVDDLVRNHMTPSVQTIAENCPLVQAARCMCQEHIHRLVVLDGHSRPVGIVSSLDVISAMVNAVEE